MSTAAIDFGTSERLVEMPFACSWPTAHFKSTALTWAAQGITVVLLYDGNTQRGKYSLNLRLYEDQTFSRAYYQPPTLPLNKPLYIGLDMDGNSGESGVQPKIRHLFLTVIKFR